MSQQPQQRIGFFRRSGRVIGAVRTVVSNVIFVLLLVFVVMLFMSAGEEIVRVPDGGALVLRLDAPVVEEAPRLDLTDLLFAAQGAARPIEMRQLVRGLDAAATDDRITALVLDLEEFPGAPPATLSALGRALEQFRERSGKSVIVMADSLTQSQYYLATYADELYLNPMGQIILSGMALQPTYFASALDKLRVNMHVFRVGDYKSAVEPFLQDEMSDLARADAQQLLSGIWVALRDRMASNRELTPAALDELINQQPDNLRRTQGDLARLALETQLVDELLTRDASIDRMINLVGADDEDRYYRHVEMRDYLRTLPSTAVSGDRKRVAVVVAEGTILDGEQPVGAAVGEHTLRQLRKARHDEGVSAVVLRINSPGGSAFASELLRREVELLQVAGKPVVASMGAMAASGGYWIGATADRILAEPTTITGSIGVYALVPTFEDSAAALGVRLDGVRTHELAGAGNPLLPLEPALADMLEQRVVAADRQFRELVARGRDMDPADVKELAEGRIWSGQDAFERDLVDQVGGLEQAVEQAAALAGLEAWQIDYLETPRSSRELLLERMLQSRLGQLAVQAIASNGLNGWYSLFITAPDQRAALQLLQSRQQLHALCVVCGVRME